jgi:hypothetical protein
MSEKHKSKYKKPENKKPTYRKDLKDYTLDDKDGKLNPKSTGEKQANVLRKTDKQMVDDGKYDVKYNADDRLYKDLDDAEYDPKHAAKIMKKRQDKDEKDNAKNIKDRIENLTREGKERLVREYVKRKFLSALFEQAPPAPEEEAPAEEPVTDPAAETPPADASTPPADAAAPAPDMSAPPAPDMSTPPADASAAPPAAPTPAAAPTPEAPAEEPAAASPEEKAKEDIAKQKIALKYWEEMLGSQTGPNSLVDTGFDPLAKALGNLSPKDLRLAKIMILRRLSKVHPAKQKEVNNKPE